MSRSRAGIPLAATLIVVSGIPAGAADPVAGWQANVFVQEAFPKQTRTNRQIGEINAAFGTDFEDWDDVHNLSLGLQLFRRVTPRWFLGLELDYSRGAVGFMVRDGAIAEPVAEITIASNLIDMFSTLEPGSDLEFRRGIDAPTLLVPEMTVAAA